MASVMADVLCPLHSFVVVHVETSVDGLNYASAPGMQRLRFSFILDISGLELSLIELIGLANDEICVLRGGGRYMFVPIEDNIGPEGLEGEAILASADGADIRHEAEDEGKEIEGGKSDSSGEENITLGAVLAVLVPVTT